MWINLDLSLLSRSSSSPTTWISTTALSSRTPDLTLWSGSGSRWEIIIIDIEEEHKKRWGTLLDRGCHQFSWLLVTVQGQGSQEDVDLLHEGHADFQEGQGGIQEEEVQERVTWYLQLVTSYPVCVGTYTMCCFCMIVAPNILLYYCYLSNYMFPKISYFLLYISYSMKNLLFLFF